MLEKKNAKPTAIKNSSRIPAWSKIHFFGSFCVRKEYALAEE